MWKNLFGLKLSFATSPHCRLILSVIAHILNFLRDPRASTHCGTYRKLSYGSYYPIYEYEISQFQVLILLYAFGSKFDKD